MKNPHAIKNLPEELLTTEICFNAIKDNKFACLHAIENIPEKFWTEELADIVLNNTKEYAGYLGKILEKYRSEKICLQVLSFGGDSNIRYIPKKFQTEEFYIKAVKRTPTLIHWIPTEFKTDTLLREVLKEHCEEENIEKIIKYFDDEVCLKYAGKKFDLVRWMNFFEGKGEIDEHEFYIRLKTDELWGHSASK